MHTRTYINFLFYYLLGNALLQMANAQTPDVKNNGSSRRRLKGSLAHTQAPSTQPTFTKHKNPNILLIMADDFRDELSNVNSQAVLPSLRSLQQRSITFRNAITVDPVCGPSRKVSLTGVRHPNTKTFDQSYQAAGLTSYFKVLKDEADYFAVDIGKIDHAYPFELKWQLLFNSNETNTPNPIVTNGNSDCSQHEIGCIIPKQQSADTKVATAASDMMQTCANLLNSGTNANCFIAVGFKHSHIEWAAYKNYKYTQRSTNTTSPNVDYAGFKYLLRHKACNDELSSYSIGRQKIFSGRITSADQITSSQKTTQQLYNAYMDALSGVDFQIGKILGALEAQTLADSSSLADNTIVVFTADHGWSLGEENLWCKRNPVPEAQNIPFMFAWPGVTDQGGTASALISNDDLFCTFMDIVFGNEYVTNFVHPSGIKPTCVSFLPALKDPNVAIRKWTFSSVYRCENPALTEMSNPCTSDTKTGTCDRPYIQWAGYSATGIFNGQQCTYTGWWPWQEIRTGCEKPTWYAQPAALNGFGVVSPQIDLFNSGPIFRRGSVAVKPIQQELLCHGADYLYGEGDNPNTINRINNPAYVAFVAQAQQQIQENYPTIGGTFPWPGPSPS